LHEILKWGKWRTYYRPNTCLQRQGEESNYIGVVLQGKLAAYTEDEITRSKKLSHWIEKYHLMGSEDFSSKFRTARRTISMPGAPNAPADGEEAEAAEDEEASMYKWVTQDDALKLSQGIALEFPSGAIGPLLLEDQKDLKDRVEQMRKSGARPDMPVLVTITPVAMFVWDIKDLKRLMLADPHVESSLSTILRGDISYKLDHAAVGSLGTRVCGIPTQARGDQDVRMCNVNPE
jgi:CRP-like cAMP-binding protein